MSQALAQACASQGQVVVVLGEAGVGKTRLITALEEATTRRGAQVLIGQAYETERLLPFGPWVQAIREAGVVNSRALEGLGAGWLGELAYLFPELRPPEWPLPSEPIEALRLFEAMTELVKSLAARQPLVLLLEDLHWADEMSVRLFSFLGRRLEGRRILLVGTGREEELDGASPVRRMLAELSQEERLIRLALAPLSREHTRELVRSLAQGSSADEASLTRLEDRVWTLSEGNPFVIVESLREVLATARRPTLPDLPAVPEKVRELIVGRFERLSDAGQHLLATAAVIGRDFEFRLLQRAADVGEADAVSVVEALVRTHILHSVGERFDFTHDRLREVAYERLLATRRRMLHARVVAALEEVYAAPDATDTVQQDRLAEHVERLAYHAVRGELRDKAVPYLRQAGLRATARSALPEALAWFEQALGVLETLPESQVTLEQGCDIRIALREVLAELGKVQWARDRLREAEVLAEKLNDEQRRGRVCAQMANILRLLGELDEAYASGARAREIATRLGNVRLRIVATRHLEEVLLYRGEYARAVELATDNLAALATNWFYLSSRERQSAAWDRCYLSQSLAQLGRLAEASQYATEAIRLSEPTDRAIIVGFVHLSAGWLHVLKGEWATAAALIEHATAFYRSGSVELQLPLAVSSSAHVLAKLGEMCEALNRLQEGEQLIERQTRPTPVLGGVYLSLGRACLLLGRLDESRRLGERAVEVSANKPGERTAALLLLGDISAHPDRFDAESAETNYREALALAEPRGMRPLAAHCHLGLGKLYRRTGKHQQAHGHLATATTMYREMGLTYWLEQAEAERATVLVAESA